MKTIRQLLRQPIKTAFGILLISLAVAVLCVCVGQTVAAAKAGEEIGDTFVTFAFPSEKYGAEADGWLKAYAEENPDIIKRVSQPSFVSAYIPSLAVDNFTSYKHYGEDYNCAPYNSLAVEVTVTEIALPQWEENGPYTVEIKGTIDSYLAAEEGFADNVGYNVRMFLEVASKDEFASEGITVGEKYLVYGKDLDDYDYKLRNSIANEKDVELSPNFMRGSMTTYYGGEMARIRIGSIYTLISGEAIGMVDTVGFKVEKISPASDRNGEWDKIIETVEINSHAFPIMGVGSLEEVSNFIQRRASVTEGRDFTDAELASGTKVCIVSKTVAEKSGVNIGDTIELNFYVSEEEVSLLTNPSAKYYGIGEATVTDTYTVIGFYTRTADWVDSGEDVSAFTPNTVFVPQTSLTLYGEGGCGGVFRTFILHNGTLNVFVSDLVESGYDEALSYRDGGYGEFERNLNGYRSMAVRAMLIGLAVYFIILAVFVLIFPTRQEKTVWTMDSLGTSRILRIRHLVLSAFGILLSGSVVGVGVGLLLWQTVVDALLGSSKGAFEVNMDVGTLILIAIAQLLFATVLVTLVSIPVTKSKSLAYRK